MERDGKISLANILFLWSFPIPSCSTPQTRGFGLILKVSINPHIYIDIIYIIYIVYLLYILYIYYISIIYLLYIYIYIISILYMHLYIYILYLYYICISIYIYMCVYSVYIYIYTLADFGTSPRLGRAGITQALVVACPLEQADMEFHISIPKMTFLFLLLSTKNSQSSTDQQGSSQRPVAEVHLMRSASLEDQLQLPCRRS